MPLDADAISRLYRSHAETMLGFFVRRVYDPEAAMDLVAETFAGAFADRRRFRGSSDEEAAAWIYSIARHRLADFLRRGRLERRTLTRLGFQRRALTDLEYDRIEELASLGDLRVQIAAELNLLGSEHRRALQLRVVEQRSYPQVGQELGVSEQAARARVSRGLSALRRSPALSAATEGHQHGV